MNEPVHTLRVADRKLARVPHEHTSRTIRHRCSFEMEMEVNKHLFVLLLQQTEQNNEGE